MNLSVKERARELILGISGDLAHYAELSRLLLTQHALLVAHDADGLTAHNPQQNQVMALIQRQAQLRCQHLHALRLKPDDQGMATFISKLPPAMQPPISQQWQQLEHLLRQCKHQNEINGRLLAGQIEVLHSLLGQEPGYGKQAHFTD